MSTSQGITLHPSLESVLGEHLDDSATIVGRLISAFILWETGAFHSYLGIPLEVSVGNLEGSVQLV